MTAFTLRNDDVGIESIRRPMAIGRDVWSPAVRKETNYADTMIL